MTTHGPPIALAGGALLLALACGGTAAPELPSLPVDLEQFDERVADLITTTHAELARDSADPERWMSLGMVYEAHRLVDLPGPCYERALELRSDEPKWWYRLAMARAANDEFDTALVALERSIGLFPEYAPAHAKRGAWLLERGEFDEALASFERANQLAPEDPAGLLGVVQLQLKRGENEEAIAALEGHAVLAGSNGLFAKKLLGTAYLRAGDLERAKAALNISKAAKPQFNDPWLAEVVSYRRGMASDNREARQLMEAGRVVEAIALLERARKQEPDHIPILRTLGAAYAKAGRTVASIEVLRRAADLDPDNVDLLVDVAWAHATAGQNQAALTEIDAVLAEMPEKGSAHALRSRLLMDLGRSAEAVEAFEQAMQHGARDPGHLVDIGKAQLELGKPADALVSFELASRQSPSLATTWIGQVISQLELGAPEAARVALDRAQALDPTDPMVVTLRSHLDGQQALVAEKSSAVAPEEEDD